MPSDRINRSSLERWAAKGLKAQRAVDRVMRARPKGDTSLVLRSGSSAADDLPAYVTKAEVDQARQLANFETAAFIGLLWGTGARVSEALALRPMDIDAENGVVRLPTLKRRRKDGTGRKTSAARVVPVAGRHLPGVLGVALAHATDREARIFRWGRQHAWRLVSAALRAAGVDAERAKPHAIRHGHAIHAVRNGVALNLIQRQLGHASLVTTGIYLRATGQDVRAAYARFDW